MTSARASSLRTLVPLTLAGAAGFWLANLVISLTPLAADYRAALGISYVPMLIEALAGGLVIAGCVSTCLMVSRRRGSQIATVAGHYPVFRVDPRGSMRTDRQPP